MYKVLVDYLMNIKVKIEKFKNERLRIISLDKACILSVWHEKTCFWELLLIIGELDGDPKFGINDYIDLMETRKVTRLTVQRFLTSRILAGDVLETRGAKKSRKTLVLSQNVFNSLDIYFNGLRG
tara:strand:- start:110 stop:484 length:375 start_codon:yes stop_codon:yes gene_type:complete